LEYAQLIQDRRIKGSKLEWMEVVNNLTKAESEEMEKNLNNRNDWVCHKASNGS
jgi:hypothetical protein